MRMNPCEGRAAGWEFLKLIDLLRSELLGR